MNQGWQEAELQSEHAASPGPSFTPEQNSSTLLKMRCPNCQKNYSVEKSWVQAAPRNSQGAFVTPMRFECFSCKSRFEALRPPAPGASILATSLIPVSAPAKNPSVRSPLDSFSDVPKQERSALAKVPLIAQTLKCPKCGVRTNGLATECLSCGVVFSRYKPLPDGAVGEIRLEGRRDITDLWETIIGDYENEIRHENFVEVCADAQCLAYAAQKYAGILAVSPQEEIARRMKKRIVALASYPLETRGSDGLHSFRIPKFVDLILFLAAATATIGFVLPHNKNVALIGTLVIGLALGIRYFLRPGIE